jgi:di/tricarboxylate transporter
MNESILTIATFSVLIGVFIAFIKEKIAPHLAAFTGMAVLLIIGAISTKDMLSVFSNSAPITIACMFIISAALNQTGVVDTMGRFLLRLSKKNKYLSVILMILLVVFVSAFINNTPVVIVFTPVVIALAEKLKEYPSKYLIPLSYAAILGGTCTLIGTSTNILISGIAQEYGQKPFDMFEITGAGLIMAASGLIFIALIGRFLLPERIPPKNNLDLEHKPIKRFMAEAIIPLDSPLIGLSINEIKFSDSEDYEIIDLVRKDIGARMAYSSQIDQEVSFEGKKNNLSDFSIATSFRDIKLKAGDRVIFKLEKNEIIEIHKHIGIKFNTDKTHFTEPLPTKKVIIAEGIIPPTSRFIGLRIKDLKLRRAYGCFAIALHRQNKNITGDFPTLVLKEGDSLILEGSKEDMNRLFEDEDIVNASFVKSSTWNKTKAPIAIATMVGVVGLSAWNIMPIAGLSVIGALVVILSGCITTEKAYESIHWRILLLVFGMLGIGMAMDNTGAAKCFVAYTAGLVHGCGPIVLVAAIYLLTSALTEIITTNAVAILITPIVIGIATTLGYNPRPFIVAVIFGSSASFATPVGYQTNAFVYIAGGYKFTDFLKIGIPMNIIMLAVATFIIPLFWPF